MDRLNWQTTSIMEFGELSELALFLDLDGTLIDIAPTPDGIVIPRGVPSLLASMALKMKGALAILTGRSIVEVDRYLAPLVPIAAGVHGAEIRVSSDGIVECRAEPIDTRIVGAVSDMARREHGVIVEVKNASIAVHYRLAIDAQPRIEKALQRILEVGDEHLILCRGRKVLEIVPKRVSKGSALETIMRLPAFLGRRPVMIGDDVSDISAFEAAVRLGGLGLRVGGEQFEAAAADFASPAAVRAWLAEQAEKSR
jgi:trehalose 6-phosphate phosphatase